ncbi:MAG: peptidoglycan editing factor PgeF [Muribaculaceae bacterium]|nr:peptidoglycan editing factor PgeF [Muribaculaceae bacterium]
MRAIYRHSALVPEQTHSLNVAVVNNPWDSFKDTDALVTFEEDLPIGILTADCVPILVYAPDITGVAAIHAGWKGTLGGIVDKALDVLEKHGASTEEMIVSFGPSILQENYEVDREMGERFSDAGFQEYVSWSDGSDGKPHIDLQGINMERLMHRGVKKENIRLSALCTSATRDKEGNPVFPSYRRDGNLAKRMLTSIMILSESEMKHYEKLFKRANEVVDEKESE